MDITLIKTAYQNKGLFEKKIGGRTTTETWSGGRISGVEERILKEKALAFRRVLDDWMRLDKDKHADRRAVIDLGSVKVGREGYKLEVCIGEGYKFATWADLLDYAVYLMENIDAINERTEATREAKRQLDSYLVSDLLDKKI